MKDIDIFLLLVTAFNLGLTWSILFKFKDVKDRLNAFELKWDQFTKYDLFNMLLKDRMYINSSVKSNLEELLPDHYISENGTKGKLYKK